MSTAPPASILTMLGAGAAPTLLLARRWSSARHEKKPLVAGSMGYRRRDLVSWLMTRWALLWEVAPARIPLRVGEGVPVGGDRALPDFSQNQRPYLDPLSDFLSLSKNLQSPDKTNVCVEVLRQQQQRVLVYYDPVFRGLLLLLIAIHSHLTLAQRKANINPTYSQQTPNSIGHLLGISQSLRDIASNFYTVG